MARLIGPDQQNRMFLLTTGPDAGRAWAPPGTPVPLYADAQASIPANVLGLDNTVIAGTPPTVLIGDTYEAPLFKYPDDVDVVYTRILGGPVVALQASSDTRLDSLEARVGTLEPEATSLAEALADETDDRVAADTALAQTDTALAAADTALAALLAASTVLLPAPTGTDDTAAINTLLAANAGKIIRGRPSSVYLTSAPLIVRSGTTLDMTGCTVRLKPGSLCNMVQNYAVGQNRRVLDAAVTSGQATLTSATAAFTSADVGKPVTVQGAGTSGATLNTTITAVTNSTTATLATNAATTVSGAYLAVGARDSDITVTGGTWDRQSNGPTGVWDAHNLRFRHVDGLVVTGTTHKSTAGKYAVNPGDCTRIKVRNTSLIGFSSDGVHINGPCERIEITGTIGDEMHDDLVSITARDSTPIITDTAGDVTDVVIDTALFATSTPGGFASALKLVAGAGCTVRRVTAKHLTAPNTTAPVVYAGDVSGGTFQDITVEDVRSLGGSSAGPVLLHGGTMDMIQLRDLAPAATDSYGVAVDCAVTRLRVDGIDWLSTTGSPNAVRVTAAAGNVARLIVSNVQMEAANQSNLVRVDTSGTVGRLVISDCTVEKLRGLSAPSGAGGITSVEISNLVATGVDYPVGVISTVTRLKLSNVTGSGMSGWVWVTGSGEATIVGATGLSGDADTYLGAVVSAARSGNVFVADPNLFTAGEESVSRLLATSNPQLNTGRLTLTYFTARRTESINQVRTYSRDTATATPTLCRIGIYAVASNGDLTLVASTANDTTLWAGTFASYTRALTSTWSKQAGKRYALGVLAVAATAPRLSGLLPVTGSEGSVAPRLNGSVDGQSDLPASVTAGTVANAAGISVYAAMVP